MGACYCLRNSGKCTTAATVDTLRHLEPFGNFVGCQLRCYDMVLSAQHAFLLLKYDHRGPTYIRLDYGDSGVFSDMSLEQSHLHSKNENGTRCQQVETLSNLVPIQLVRQLVQYGNWTKLSYHLTNHNCLHFAKLIVNLFRTSQRPPPQIPRSWLHLECSFSSCTVLLDGTNSLFVQLGQKSDEPFRERFHQLSFGDAGWEYCDVQKQRSPENSIVHIEKCVSSKTVHSLLENYWQDATSSKTSRHFVAVVVAAFEGE
eukprot:TRINITY_DN22208_c0_g1_i1.p1 TRINITY_DN22208_c0_g1~~TRINITY_DN22208_c0_g1_i1.p1  ORF type:complete len:258 (+),score=33.82 TRINITY_DN22208_c0_g1_i1:45-818(+)